MTNIVKTKFTNKSTNIEVLASKLNKMWGYTFGITYCVSGLDKLYVTFKGDDKLSYETQLEWINKFANYFGLQVEKNIYE